MDGPETGQSADRFRHSPRCDYDADDPESECHCIDPRSNPLLECGHRLEDYCYCSEM